MVRKKVFWIIIIILLSRNLAGCAGYLQSTQGARARFDKGLFLDASIEYKKGLKHPGRDYLLYLLDTGLSLHYAGRYEESNNFLLEADKYAEEINYISITRETASLLATDYTLKYRGEDYEKILINTYLAINYLMLGDYENARVEAKRVNEKIGKYNSDGELNYKLNPFSIYLSGIIYEINGEPNDAYIDYKKVYDLLPNFPLVKKDLIRLSTLLNFDDDYKTWRTRFDLKDIKQDDHSNGELIFIFQCGYSPQKHQEMRVIAVPAYHPRLSIISYAKVYINGEYYDQTYILEDIERTAIDQLNAKIARIIAKQTAVSAGKYVIANTIGKETNQPIVRDILLLFFYATNEADLRSWLTLPQNIQISRISLPEGNYQVMVKFYDKNHMFVEQKIWSDVKIGKNGHKTTLNYRAIR
ncbi:MAG: hypothetical protein HY999_02180 [Nitrospinae bacterium]|nr:hypothetical protein [Nitrospinota bacterium]